MSPAKRTPTLDSDIGRRRSLAKTERSAAYQTRRDAVIRAAKAVFREKGYGSSSLADVAARLDTDRASLYYYVSGKQELFEEVVRDAVEHNVQEAERILRSDAPPGDKLRQVIAATMLSYEEHYPYLYEYVEADVGRPASDAGEASEITELGRRYQAAVVAIVEEGLRSHAFVSGGSAGVIALAVMGMMNWTHRWFTPHGPLTGGEIGDILASMVLDGLAGDATTPTVENRPGSSR